jgi:hypothetical protein
LEIELKNAQEEVKNKCGRNMLLFQQAEHLLKYLVSIDDISGYISEVDGKLQKQKEKTSVKTLGQLVGKFTDNTFSEHEEKAAPEVLKEAFISTSFKIESDAVFYEARKQALASMVVDRNDLNHHLLPRIQFNSIDSCRETIMYLDRQHEKHLPEIEILKNIVKSRQESIKVLAQSLDSDEFWANIDSEISANQLGK